MSIKKNFVTAAIAVSLVAGSVLVSAAPAMAAPTARAAYTATVYTKYFWDWGSCVNFYYSPPPGVRPDFWYGCKLVAPGTWAVKYTVTKARG